jgi:hypothetical protein
VRKNSVAKSGIENIESNGGEMNKWRRWRKLISESGVSGGEMAKMKSEISHHQRCKQRSLA